MHACGSGFRVEGFRVVGLIGRVSSPSAQVLGAPTLFPIS